MPYKVKTEPAARALADYWARHHRILCRVRSFGEFWEIQPVEPPFPPMWRERCDSFMAGWDAVTDAYDSKMS